MENLWFEVCSRQKIDQNVSQEWLGKILSNYSQDERVYHNQNMFLQKEKYLRERKVNDCVILAAIFQYYIFDPKKDSQVENCQAFRDFLAAAKVDNVSHILGVSKDIPICTKHMPLGFQDNLEKYVTKLLGENNAEDMEGFQDDAQFLQDLDLAILGGTPEEYKNYTELLQKEYKYLNTEAYKSTRLKVRMNLLHENTLVR